MNLLKPASILLALLISVSLNASAPKSRDFRKACDTLSVKLQDHFGVKSKLRVKSIRAKGDKYDVIFDKTFSDYPWRPDDYKWFMEEFDKEWKKVSSSYSHGAIYCNDIPFEHLLDPELPYDGKPVKYGLKRTAPKTRRLVSRVGARHYGKGLDGRHIALWQSHGLYYNEEQDIWRWQRAPLHRTVEDLYTQSYVLDFLIPMLENAGACVLTPRERDTQKDEIICDNDPTFSRSGAAGVRRSGRYREKGSWKDAGEGFRDTKEAYEVSDNPFRTGTARKAGCSEQGESTAIWSAPVDGSGEYAVYVSYRTLPESSPRAHYTVFHAGGEAEFEVDQRMGGGTWIYLGTFRFDSLAQVELDNRGAIGRVVSADAVKFGGGMGKIARADKVSGMPSYVEGASYWMPWAGADSTLREWDTDYHNDYAARGPWVKMMRDSKGIPFDCSLAFHSDAGITPDDSIVGTLSIYTLYSDNSRAFDNGDDRMSCRLLADWVQTQTVNDIRRDFEPEWTRRELWDRKYSESRTSDVPAMLLELLSHQNFADMKYGLDPSFRFTVARAVYKGMLKFLSSLYGVEYAVQPLPVKDMAIKFTGSGKARLSWNPTEDCKEPTAMPDSYIIYKRIDDGAFDNGTATNKREVEFNITEDHIYSFKVVAQNEGGMSFPSEILSIGRPEGCTESPVLVVNNFDRVSAPSWIDTPDYAGFTAGTDSGVPYIRDITYIGENYEFQRSLEWVTDDNPGFGASVTDEAGRVIAGNSFDYPFIHGKALMASGRAFCSMSRSAFTADRTLVPSGCVLDLICGKQVTTLVGSGRAGTRYSVFPEDLRNAIESWVTAGGNIFISGANIATDVWSSVYQGCGSSKETKDFVSGILGYKLSSTHATGKGLVGDFEFHDNLNEDCYCVESPDGLAPADKNAMIWIRYPGSRIPAGIAFKGKGYEVVSLGVPLECIKKEEDRQALLRMAFSKF